MFGACEPMSYSLCMWHQYLFSLDKTIRTIITEMMEADRTKRCFCYCHYGYEANSPYPHSELRNTDPNLFCDRCQHRQGDGIIDHGWLQNNTIN